MSTQQLKREVFETSRIGEYFSQKEMRQQIGYEMEFWPAVILRELIDNALDACEAAGENPVIEVEVKDDIISVQDNGVGIPASTVEKSLDYLRRVSDKAYYVAPTRGQMGNALKVIYAAPYVYSEGKGGSVEIIASGTRHMIDVIYDCIADEPIIKHEKTDFVKNGTFVKIAWTDSTRLLTEKDVSFYISTPPTANELIAGYAAFNPHAIFKYNGDVVITSTKSDWNKWLPNMPTPAHWYSVETLQNLVIGYLNIQNGTSKTVREFVSEFRGLSGTAKQKKVTGDFQRATLDSFIIGRDIDREKLKTLFISMREESKPPKPKVLGVIGEDHFKHWLLNNNASEHTIKYKKSEGFDKDGLPFVLEVAFAVNKNDEAGRLLKVGLNWSPVIRSSPDTSLNEAIQSMRLDSHDPIIVVIHMAKPRFNYMDRGKTKIEL